MLKRKRVRDGNGDENTANTNSAGTSTGNILRETSKGIRAPFVKPSFTSSLTFLPKEKAGGNTKLHAVSSIPASAKLRPTLSLSNSTTPSKQSRNDSKDALNLKSASTKRSESGLIQSVLSFITPSQFTVSTRSSRSIGNAIAIEYDHDDNASRTKTTLVDGPSVAISHHHFRDHLASNTSDFIVSTPSEASSLHKAATSAVVQQQYSSRAESINSSSVVDETALMRNLKSALKLNSEQLNAATYEFIHNLPTSTSPLLLQACPGSGKTLTLCARVAYMLSSGRAMASQLLAITFTRKAASEIDARIQSTICKIGARESLRSGLTVCDFHQLSLYILRRFSSHLIFKHQFSIIDDRLRNRILNECVALWDYYHNTGKERRFELSTTADDVQLSQRVYSILPMLRDFRKNSLIAMVRPSASMPTCKMAVTTALNTIGANSEDELQAQLYILHRYHEAMLEHCYVTLEDLLPLNLGLFQVHETVRQNVQDQFRYILCDEWQDTEDSQIRLLLAIIGHANWNVPFESNLSNQNRSKNNLPTTITSITSSINHITCVGDSNQCIYSWRGANANAFSLMESILSEYHVISLHLTQNYRSTQRIVHLANEFIQRKVAKSAESSSKNPSHLKQQRESPCASESSSMWTAREEGTKIEVWMHANPTLESERIRQEIGRLRSIRKDDGTMWKFSDFAILARTHAALRILRESFKEHKIPLQKATDMRNTVSKSKKNKEEKARIANLRKSLLSLSKTKEIKSIIGILRLLCQYSSVQNLNIGTTTMEDILKESKVSFLNALSVFGTAAMIKKIESIFAGWCTQWDVIHKRYHSHLDANNCHTVSISYAHIIFTLSLPFADSSRLHPCFKMLHSFLLKCRSNSLTSKQSQLIDRFTECFRNVHESLQLITHNDDCDMGNIIDSAFTVSETYTVATAPAASTPAHKGKLIDDDDDEWDPPDFGTEMSAIISSKISSALPNAIANPTTSALASSVQTLAALASSYQLVNTTSLPSFALPSSAVVAQSSAMKPDIKNLFAAKSSSEHTPSSVVDLTDDDEFPTSTNITATNSTKSNGSDGQILQFPDVAGDFCRCTSCSSIWIDLYQFFLKVETSDESLVMLLESEDDESSSAKTNVIDNSVDKGVYISTIHQSKGLEWPIVFIAHVSEKILPLSHDSQYVTNDNSSDDPDEDLAISSDSDEERRLCYVACTRAKKMLYLNAILCDESGQPMLPSPFLHEMPSIVLNWSSPNATSQCSTSSSGQGLSKTSSFSSSSALSCKQENRLTGFLPDPSRMPSLSRSYNDISTDSLTTQHMAASSQFRTAASMMDL